MLTSPDRTAFDGSTLTIHDGMGHELPVALWPELTAAILANARRAINRAPHGEKWAYRHAAAALAELGRLDEARSELLTAVAMLREMGMTLWLPEAEAELAASSSTTAD